MIKLLKKYSFMKSNEMLKRNKFTYETYIDKLVNGCS